MVKNVNKIECNIALSKNKLDQHYSPNSRSFVQETFPKTLPQFVLILISLTRWQHIAHNETKHFVSPHLIGPQLHQHNLASK